MDENQQRPISILNPLEPAFEKTKEVLFQPFEIVKWFALGFCVWLAQLLSGKSSLGNVSRSYSKDDFGNLDRIGDWLELWWVLFIIAAAIVIGLVVWVLFTWLSSRGKFMFLDNLVKNEAQIQQTWHDFKQPGNNLFSFYIIMGIIAAVTILLFVGMGLTLAIPSFSANEFTISTFIGLLVLIIPLILLIVGWSIFFTLINDFVVPLMYLKNHRAGDALREYWQTLLQPNVGMFVLYLLFKIILAIVIAVITIFITCLTCCIAALPYLGTVILLPFHVFMRSYSLYFLSQFGDEYDVWKEKQTLPEATNF